ncbi:MAG: peroxiredoxin [Aphanothece saxicola GSE-SYN-MK-01-06B]|nr:peroxiredoxin [Aphanothece saxicola GSE-SYN-MK-01-06B]
MASRSSCCQRPGCSCIGRRPHAPPSSQAGQGPAGAVLPRLGQPHASPPSVAPALAPGDTAPLIALPDQDGTERRSDQLEGKALVLFFYPKDDTPGCTMEACAFRDSYADLQGLGAAVWGVSGDDAASHRRFANRHRLPFPLLVDAGNRLRKAFGVPSVLGLLPGRVTYVIDGQGVVRHVFNNLLDGPAHRREALDALRGLQGA